MARFPAQRPAQPYLPTTPGFGVTDSGCGYTMVGRETFLEYEKHLGSAHNLAVDKSPSTKTFKFGNDAVLPALYEARIPICIRDITGNHYIQGFFKAALVEGAAPLLISKAFMKVTQANLDAAGNKMFLAKISLAVRLFESQVGSHWMIKLDSFPLNEVGVAFNQQDCRVKTSEFEVMYTGDGMGR
ncbi:unnamed protein product, partial [Polarella glacialis]